MSDMTKTDEFMDVDSNIFLVERKAVGGDDIEVIAQTQSLEDAIQIAESYGEKHGTNGLRVVRLLAWKRVQ